MAYQIAFDLEESATQDFLSKVAKDIPEGNDNQEDTEMKGVCKKRNIQGLC